MHAPNIKNGKIVGFMILMLQQKVVVVVVVVLVSGVGLHSKQKLFGLHWFASFDKSPN